LFPAAAIRSDLGMALTSLRFLGPELLTTGLVANQLTVRGLMSKLSLPVPDFNMPDEFSVAVCVVSACGATST
jgi:hypothetical protein